MQLLPEFIPEKALPCPSDLVHTDMLDHGFVHVNSWHDRLDHHIYRHPEREIDIHLTYHASRCAVYFPDSKQPGDLFAKLYLLPSVYTAYENTLSFIFTFWAFDILCLELGIVKPRPKKEKPKKVEVVKEEVKATEPPKQETQKDLFS